LFLQNNGQTVNGKRQTPRVFEENSKVNVFNIHTPTQQKTRQKKQQAQKSKHIKQKKVKFYAVKVWELKHRSER